MKRRYTFWFTGWFTGKRHGRALLRGQWGAWIGACLVTASPVWAQQISGDESTTIGSPDQLNFMITGGNRAGGNLFHSFSSFSVPTSGSAFFNNAPEIENIISQVTGGSVSLINGLIQANGTANLFLLNPSGIVFGPNARLNIGGSFLATTATSLKFDQGNQFTASASPPLLSVNVPIGLQFGRSSGGIFVQGSTLAVQPAKTLALLGGDLTLSGGRLIAVGGRIELGSVAGPSLVSLTPTDASLVLGYAGVEFQDIQLSQQAFVTTTGLDGGATQVQGRRVTLSDGSRILTTTRGSDPGRALSVNASESVEVVGTSADGQTSSGLLNVTTGAGAAGDLLINTGRLLVRDGAQVISSTSSTGTAGNVTVNASESVELSGTSPDGLIPSSLRSDALVNVLNVSPVFREQFNLSGIVTGNAGDLTITTGQLIVQDGAEVAVSNEGAGNGGTLGIQARSIRLDNQGKLIAVTASGEGGNITLQAEDLLLRRGAQISTTAGSSGNGGNLTIDAQLLTALENSQITANAFTGQGGNIQITAQGVFLGPNSQITASSQLGITGVVDIQTPDTNPSKELAIVPEVVDVTGLIAQGCGAGDGLASSKFTVTGRGGVPSSPSETLESDTVLADLGLADLGTAPVGSGSGTPISTVASPASPLVEAQGWVIRPNGEVVLIAQAPNAAAYSPWLTPAQCHEP